MTVFEPVGKAFPPLRRIGRDLVRTRCDRRARGNRRRSGVSAGEPESRIDAAGCVAWRTVCLVRRPGGRGAEHEVVFRGRHVRRRPGRLVPQPNLAGTLTGSVRRTTDRGLGWFITPEHLACPAIAGRSLVVEHGDGTCRSWTLDSVESLPDGTRLHVREEPGFLIDPRNGVAQYYQFPQVKAPGPHRFRVSRSPTEEP